MRLLPRGGLRRRRTFHDGGFTLVELVVTMFVIATVLLGLITVQVRALQTVELAKQRQQATALANRTMEQLRALPYDTVTAGLKTNDLVEVGGPNLQLVSGIWRFKPTYDTSIDEVLKHTSSQAQPPLYKHVQDATTPGTPTKVGHVQYRVRTYVTVPNGLANQGVLLTVVVDWSSSVTSGQTKATAVRSRLFSPTGCSANSTATRPFAGACQAFFYSDAGLAPAGITVTAVDADTPLVGTSDVTELEATLPSVSTRTQSEQIVFAQSTVSTSEATITQAGVTGTQGGETASSAADVDPASGSANSPAAEAPVTYSGTTPLGGGGGGTGVDASYFVNVPAASGSTYSTTAAAASPVCADTSAVALVTNQGCSSGNISPAGTYSASVSFSLPERNLGDTILAGITTPGSSWRAFGGRAVTPIAGHCTGTSGAGCMAAGATRTVSEMLVGSLPATTPPDQVPVDFTSMVILGALTSTASAEAGIAASPGASTRSAASSLYWDGDSYESLAVLDAGQTQALGTATGIYQLSAIRDLEIVLSGEVTVDPTLVATEPAPCVSTACSVKATAGAVRATIQYDVVSVDWNADRTSSTRTVMGNFVVSSSTGNTVAQATYKAAPVE